MRSSSESFAVRNSTGVSWPSPRTPLQNLQSVDVGQHHVEHDDIGAELAGERDRLAALARGLDLPAFVAQRHREQVGEGGLIVDDESTHRRPVGPREAGPGGGGTGRKPCVVYGHVFKYSQSPKRTL